MKKAYLIGSLIAVALAPAAMAIPGTISIIQTPGANYGGGGQFTATAIGGDVPGVFQTFCVESGNHISVGVSYSYDSTLNDGSGNPLTLGTAWLYNQFEKGTLGGYAANSTQAGLLQGALWYFQGQGQPGNGFPFNISATNPYAIEAQTALSGGGFTDSTGQYGVEILDLTDANGANIQSLLGETTPTVPDGGSSVALLGFALLGFESLRRKLAR